MSERTAIDLTATVTTPENIQFEYRIAGPFRRIPAFFVDLLVRAITMASVAILLFCSGITAAIPVGGSIGIVFILLCYFFLDWFYGVFFEAYFNGKTPGKWISKIQVISADGRPINAYQATIRNFLRLGDFAPMLSFEIFSPDAPPQYMIPTGLVAIVCMAVTKRFQRLGDLAAGTMVVVDERKWVPPNVKLEDPRVASLAQYIPASFRMSRSLARAVALYAERRARMPIPRRMELASIIAKPLLREFEFRDDTSPDLLLCALYYREFMTKEAFVADSRQRMPKVPPPSPLASQQTPATIADPNTSMPPMLTNTQAILSVDGGTGSIIAEQIVEQAENIIHAQVLETQVPGISELTTRESSVHSNKEDTSV